MKKLQRRGSRLCHAAAAVDVTGFRLNALEAAAEGAGKEGAETLPHGGGGVFAGAFNKRTGKVLKKNGLSQHGTIILFAYPFSFLHFSLKAKLVFKPFRVTRCLIRKRFWFDVPYLTVQFRREKSAKCRSALPRPPPPKNHNSTCAFEFQLTVVLLSRYFDYDGWA